ncbi:hypothetical protein [Spiroplasma endosymbiont of Polydrusus pterygomalis]|uniref:hypothetical protein n=1 Tax=Spiroplasma endosymbiont of Polydrusus pterygomalis TaxID=3139327 RepID=UPI003CCB183A
MIKNHKKKLALKLKKHSKSMKVLSQKNIIDNQINVIDNQINVIAKVNAWLATQNDFQNLKLLSEVASQQKYLTANNKLNVKMINQYVNSFASDDSSLNQTFKKISL